MKAIFKEMTYRGLMMGRPNSERNDDRLKQAIDYATDHHCHIPHKPYLIEPPRRQYFRKPGDMDRTNSDHWTAEWLPVVTCIGEFQSVMPARDDRKDFSALTVVWFEDDFGADISSGNLKSIQNIPWKEVAVDYDW